MTLQAYTTFEPVRAEQIPSLGLEYQEYRHRVTGARHIHLSADDPHNVFMVALRTVPADSTGVAHILEHTALCGSDRYPVRDPFFLMTRRSLNTFMNAFTGADWTGYPFASQNRKDFDNLLSVYLDAVFFPNLDQLDFAQEGHRLEWVAGEEQARRLEFKGVVYNEMKGAMSNPVSRLWHTLSHHLYPTTTYHYNSGGDPAAIPDLTHEGLIEFHRSHYHPGNATFLTYGDRTATELQETFEQLALGRFTGSQPPFAIADEQRLDETLRVEGRYPVDRQEPLDERTHIVLGWLLGHNHSTRGVMEANLLAGVLLDNSASPLRCALETTPLASAPSPLCGVDDSHREMVFAAGVEGAEGESADQVEELILNTLEQIATEGVDHAQVEAVLHQLELSQREIGGGHYPYGLQLLLNLMTPALHGGDPVAALEIDPALRELREAIADRDYIPSLVRRLLLDNRHRVRLVLRPDHELADEELADERRRLEEIAQGLDEAQSKQIDEQAGELAERQERVDDPELLPRVELGDVPAELVIANGEVIDGEMPVHWYAQGTNGLVYQELVVELPELSDESIALLPLFCSLLSEVGSGGRDYLTTQSLQAAVTGGIGARISIRGAPDDPGRVKGYFILSGKALSRNHAALSRLLHETLVTVRFDELQRIRELVAQERADLEQGVVGQGHSLAMLAASAGMTPGSALAHRWRGLAGIRDFKRFDDQLDRNDELQGVASRLELLRQQLIAGPRQLLLIGEGGQREALIDVAREQWSRLPLAADRPSLVLNAGQRRVNEVWSTSTQVNFVASAYATVPSAHPDAPALMVLAGLLRNGYLHRAIREQGGAYGGGASYDPDSTAFRFYSYRDPRWAETLEEYGRSLEWLQSTDHPWRSVEEAILGVVSRIDQPGSPAGEARSAFYNQLHGRTPEHRKRIRSGVLAVTASDLKRVAQRYLEPGSRHTAILTSSPQAALASERLGLTVESL